MPTFFARRYMRKLEQVGSTEKVLGLVILLLLASLAALFGAQVATDDEYLFNVDDATYRGEGEARGPAAASEGGADGLQNPFPDPGIEGWLPPRKVSRFTPENLYLKINGRADAYLQFHVVGLTFGTYHHQTDSDRALDVYWYDMGESENAFGMYRSEAPPDLEPVEFGREGYQTGGAVYFWKGSSYIQVLPTSFDAVDPTAALKIAERLAERAAGP